MHKDILYSEFLMFDPGNNYGHNSVFSGFRKLWYTNLVPKTDNNNGGLWSKLSNYDL